MTDIQIYNEYCKKTGNADIILSYEELKLEGINMIALVKRKDIELKSHRILNIPIELYDDNAEIVRALSKTMKTDEFLIRCQVIQDKAFMINDKSNNIKPVNYNIMKSLYESFINLAGASSELAKSDSDLIKWFIQANPNIKIMFMEETDELNIKAFPTSKYTMKYFKYYIHSNYIQITNIMNNKGKCKPLIK